MAGELSQSARQGAGAQQVRRLAITAPRLTPCPGTGTLVSSRVARKSAHGCPVALAGCITARFGRRTVAISLPETAKDAASNHSAGEIAPLSCISKKNKKHAGAVCDRLSAVVFMSRSGSAAGPKVAWHLTFAWRTRGCKMNVQNEIPSRQRLLDLQARQLNTRDSSRALPNWLQHDKVMNLPIRLKDCHVYSSLLQQMPKMLALRKKRIHSRGDDERRWLGGCLVLLHENGRGQNVRSVVALRYERIYHPLQKGNPEIRAVVECLIRLALIEGICDGIEEPKSSLGPPSETIWFKCHTHT